ncbi:U3 small nucleolar RNA-associated protein 15 [Diutina catenulata]
MSSSRPRVAPLKHATLPNQTTPEQRYWRGFTNPQLIKESRAVNHIEFNPVTQDFAVVSSTRIQVFSAKTRQVIKTFSRFKDTVHTSAYRYDGKLMAASDATGLVSIYDAYNPRAQLVNITPSSHPSHAVKFHPSVGNHLAIGSDDRVLRIYDISQSALGPIQSFDDHGDYIRSISFVPGNPNLIATGCYDGIVRVFDTRANEKISEFDQHNPVEDVLAISPTTLVSAGGPCVKIWDLARGKKINQLDNFTKAATCLHNTGDRGLLVGSLDGHVKIFDYTTSNFEVKFGWKFSSGGVLSCAVSPGAEHKHFVTGLTSGLISMRSRKTEPKGSAPQPPAERTNAYNRIFKGKDYLGEEEHRVIYSSTPHQKKLKQFEKHLVAFKWSEALDSAFLTGVPKETTVTVLNELKKRGKVRAALYGRDEISLLPILTWFTRNLEDLRSFNLICDYAAVILEMYGHLVDKSVVLEECLANFLKKVTGEIRKCREANEIGGMLELLAI